MSKKNLLATRTKTSVPRYKKKTCPFILSQITL